MENDEYFEIKGSVDDETLDDFMETLYETLETIEHDLNVLELSPESEETIHKVFRNLHTLKGNTKMVFLEPLSYFLHAVEEAFSDIRSRRSRFNRELKEVFLLSMDQFRLAAESMVQVGKIETAPLEKLSNGLLKLNQIPPEEVPRYIAELFVLLGGKLSSYLDLSPSQIAMSTLSASTHPSSPRDKMNFVEDKSKDLLFFTQIAKYIDSKSSYWENRAENILSHTFLINEEMGNCVDVDQLSAAVYLHDIGMVFIPDHILHKQEKLNSLEEKFIRRHPTLGFEWVIRMPGWETAAEIIAQHHERINGKGYPKGLQGAEIHLGAKMLAVVDTFYSITNERADRTYKRSLLRAIKEINAYVGSQFDSQVVEAFNEVIRKKIAKLSKS